MTAVVEPNVEIAEAEVAVPEGSLRIRGVIRTRAEWERLEQLIFYYGMARTGDRAHGDYTMEHCVDRAWGGAAPGDPIWYHEQASVWLPELSAALDVGCTPYATADEMKVAARGYILGQRHRLDWCGEGTDAILGQLGLEGLEPRPWPRSEFIGLFRQVVAAHYGTPDREGWIVRALLRGRPPQS